MNPCPQLSACTVPKSQEFPDTAVPQPHPSSPSSLPNPSPCCQPLSDPPGMSLAIPGVGIPVLRAFPPALGALEVLPGTFWAYLPGTRSMPAAFLHISLGHSFPLVLPKIGQEHKCPDSHLARGVVRSKCWLHPSSVPLQQLLDQGGAGFCWNFLSVVFTQLNFRVTFCDAVEPGGDWRIWGAKGVKQGAENKWDEDVGIFGLSQCVPWCCGDRPRALHESSSVGRVSSGPAERNTQSFIFLS